MGGDQAKQQMLDKYENMKKEKPVEKCGWTTFESV